MSERRKSHLECDFIGGKQTGFRSGNIERRKTRKADSLGSEIDSSRRKPFEQDVSDEREFEQNKFENFEFERTDANRERAAGEGHEAGGHRRGHADDSYVQTR